MHSSLIMHGSNANWVLHQYKDHLSQYGIPIINIVRPSYFSNLSNGNPYTSKIAAVFDKSVQ